MANAPLSETALHEAALAHLARYATTQAGLLRVLNRRIDRWLRSQVDEVEPETVATARRAARAEVERLAAQGLIDDAAFAASRARSLTRSGRSRQAIAAHLAARGVAREAASEAMPAHEDAEFAAALACAKRRRIGPFRRSEIDAEGRNRELATLARAGFPREIALRALACPPEAAETLVIALRQTLLDPP
jgi:regulatory protein